MFHMHGLLSLCYKSCITLSTRNFSFPFFCIIYTKNAFKAKLSPCLSAKWMIKVLNGWLNTSISHISILSNAHGTWPMFWPAVLRSCHIMRWDWNARFSLSVVPLDPLWFAVRCVFQCKRYHYFFDLFTNLDANSWAPLCGWLACCVTQVTHSFQFWILHVQFMTLTRDAIDAFKLSDCDRMRVVLVETLTARSTRSSAQLRQLWTFDDRRGARDIPNRNSFRRFVTAKANPKTH
jgi:hypothetical protein